MGQIDKEETIERIRAKMNSGQWSDAVMFGMKKAISIIESMQERPHGEWLRKNNSNSWFECSVCKEVSDVVTIMREPTWKFCPNCGADMREGDVDDRT